MKHTKVVNQNHFQQWCDKNGMKPRDVHALLKSTWPKLKLSPVTIHHWYIGIKDIGLEKAFFLERVSNGEMNKEKLLYTPKRLKKIKIILDSETEGKIGISENGPSECTAQVG